MRNNQFPQIDLSAQEIINCEAGGDCNGGNPGGVYEFAFTTGIADSSCEQYVAKNAKSADICSALNTCRDCSPPAPKAGETGLDKCYAVTNFKRYYVSEYGSVSGADKMKAEIYKRGPISCGIQATSTFEAYTGGIYSEKILFPQINHEIAVVGWGTSEDGEEFWWGRNSWGTYWGEQGFFQMKMHKENLGIENDCTWGVPSMSPGSDEEEKEDEILA